MTKKSAHYVIAILDILSIVGVWYVVSLYNEIMLLIESGADEVFFQNFFSLILLLIIIPIIHLFSFISWTPKIRIFGNSLLILIFLSLILTSYYLNNTIEKSLKENNYEFCSNLSETMTFSEFKTFIRTDLKCTVKEPG
jgi:hypothetical protein